MGKKGRKSKKKKVQVPIKLKNTIQQNKKASTQTSPPLERPAGREIPYWARLIATFSIPTIVVTAGLWIASERSSSSKYNDALFYRTAYIEAVGLNDEAISWAMVQAGEESAKLMGGKNEVYDIVKIGGFPNAFVGLIKLSLADNSPSIKEIRIPYKIYANKQYIDLGLIEPTLLLIDEEVYQEGEYRFSGLKQADPELIIPFCITREWTQDELDNNMSDSDFINAIDKVILRYDFYEGFHYKVSGSSREYHVPWNDMMDVRNSIALPAGRYIGDK